jgi:hypothetical protein
MKVRGFYLSLIAAALLAATLSVTRGQPAGSEETFNPTEDAKAAVDGFLCAYRSGLTDSLLLEQLGQVREWSITLQEIGDKRLVKPLTEIIADTALHSGEVDAGAIYLLLQLRGKTAVPTIRQYLNVQSKPCARLVSAAALMVLGDAESGIPVLEGYLKQPYPLSPGQVSTIIMDAFVHNSEAVELGDQAQQSRVTSFFQRIAEWASGQDLASAICYLLQQDKKSQDVAFRRAEYFLKNEHSAPRYVRSNIIGCVEKFGGKRGQALLGKYQ